MGLPFINRRKEKTQVQNRSFIAQFNFYDCDISQIYAKIKLARIKQYALTDYLGNHLFAWRKETCNLQNQMLSKCSERILMQLKEVFS